ncbi:hypothetical protein KR084_005525, partial [Drosophila pseudotakahashii]
PSTINCGGFFDVNRSLFKGLLTTMVTYLVVLLQFQISIPTDKGDSEGTTNITVVDFVMDNLDNDMSLMGSTSPSTTTAGTTLAPPMIKQKGRKG